MNGIAMTEGDRLLQVVNRLAGGNQAIFARRCNVPHASVNKVIKGVYAMSEAYIGKFCSGYPDLNPDYLRGKSGVMLKSDRGNLEAEIDRLRAENESLRWALDELRKRIDK